MKKFLIFLICFTLLFAFAGCGEKENSTTTNAETKNTNADISIIDLSAMSTTMAYSKAVEMSNNRKDYIGKHIKISGKFDVVAGDTRNYYICNVGDATACCNAGFEFALADSNLKYPDDYPNINDEITVEGTFSTYLEGEDEYIELKDAVLTK